VTLGLPAWSWANTAPLGAWSASSWVQDKCHVALGLPILLVFFFFDLRGVSGPAYAHHDYSPRPTGHPASPGAGKAPRG